MFMRQPEDMLRKQTLGQIYNGGLCIPVTTVIVIILTLIALLSIENVCELVQGSCIVRVLFQMIKVPNSIYLKISRVNKIIMVL